MKIQQYTRYLLALCILFGALSGIPAAADQTSPRLDELFTRLQLTRDQQQLRFIENAIWELWMQHENSDVEQLLVLGTRRMNAGQFPAALLIFNELTASYPDFAEAWNKRATLFYLLGEFDSSLADIEQVLELEPRHFGALSGAGLIHLQRENLNQAREAFEQLLEVHPASPNGQANLELVLERLRRNLI
jgi:Flp pilus assembly protein TadD